MRYGAIPTNLQEWLALRIGKVPMPTIDTLIPLLQARALMNGARLGILAALENGALSAEQVAARTGTNAEAVAMLLRVLESAGYVRRTGGGWELSAQGRRHFGRNAPMAAEGTLNFLFYEWDLIRAMDKLVESGESADIHTNLDDPETWQHYQLNMLEMARGMAPTVARMIPVRSGATSVLDVAGSHGLYSAELCRRHPGMRGTVLELPKAIGIARELAAAEGHGELVNHIEGDMLAGGYPPGQDVVLFSNILHHFTPEQNAQILHHAHAALNESGIVAIWDIERRPDNAPPELGGDALALFFRMTSASSVFTADDYASWLRAAGFGAVQHKRNILLPSMVLTVGRKA